jgi:WD40 repeat protein
MSGFDAAISEGISRLKAMGGDSQGSEGNGDEVPEIKAFAEFEGSPLEHDLVWTLGTWDHHTGEDSVMRRIFATANGPSIHIYDRETRDQVDEFQGAGTELTSAVVMENSRGEILLASGNVEGDVEIWDTSTSALLSHLPGPGDENPGVVALRTYQDSSGEPRLVATYRQGFSVIDPLAGTVSRTVTSPVLNDTLVYLSSRGEPRVVGGAEDGQVGGRPEDTS